MANSLIRTYLWMGALCLALASTNVFAAEEELLPSAGISGQQIQQVLPPKVVAPEIESINQPKGSFDLEDIIFYRVKIKWSEHPEGVRMVSPDALLENLELAGIGEETVSKPDPADTSIEQILTLRFKPLGSGPAKINSVTLHWTQGDGSITSALKIPATEVNIKKKTNRMLWGSLAGGFLFIMVGVIFVLKKKNTKTTLPASKSIEEETLASLDETRKSWQGGNLKDQEIPNRLIHILDGYLHQKINWNHSQEDYNVFREKCEKFWDKKEARDAIGLFEKIEYCRFSGSQLDPNELTELFQTVHSFIERKKVI